MKEILHLCKLPPGLYRTHCSTKKLYSKANIFTLTFGSDWRRPPSDAASVLSHTGSAAALRFSSSTAGGRCGSSVAAAAAADASGVAQIHQPSISFPPASFPLFVPRVALNFQPPWLLPWGATLLGFWVSYCHLLYKTSWLLPPPAPPSLLSVFQPFACSSSAFSTLWRDGYSFDHSFCWSFSSLSLYI